MTELVWFNGKVQPLAQASMGLEDRGFQFADGVYEVIRTYSGKPFALRAHLERLQNSAGAISLQLPLSLEKLADEIGGLISKSGLGEGMIYLQLTRGAAPRNHVFASVPPTLLFYTRALEPLAAPGKGACVRLLSYPDDRWKRCWIKSIALLPNVLAKNAAVAAGADEAVFVDNHVVTECSASNVVAIIDRKMVTHPVGPRVLPGITRAYLIQCAHELGMAVEERPILLDEARRADELFICSTTREVSPVSHWDGQAVKPGGCGPVTLRLHEALRRRIARECELA